MVLGYGNVTVFILDLILIGDLSREAAVEIGSEILSFFFFNGKYRERIKCRVTTYNRGFARIFTGDKPFGIPLLRLTRITDMCLSCQTLSVQNVLGTAMLFLV